MKHFAFPTILKTIIIIVNFESSEQRKIYSFIPLCCQKSQVFNDSECIRNNEVFTEEFPYLKYESGWINSTEISFKDIFLENCSHFIDLPFQNSHSAVDGIFIFDNGSIYLNIREGYDDSFTYSNSEFCVMKYEESIYSVRLCIVTQKESTKDLGEKHPQGNNYLDCKRNICISKCCGKGSHVSFRPRFGCSPYENSELESFNPSFKFVNGSEISALDKNISYIVQFPLCRLYGTKDLNLLPNGSIFIPRTKEVISRDKYCLDMFQIGGRSYITKVLAYYFKMNMLI